MNVLFVSLALSGWTPIQMCDLKQLGQPAGFVSQTLAYSRL